MLDSAVPSADPPLRVIVNGAAGRMGRTLLAVVLDDPRCRLVGALERPGAETEGADAGILAGRPAVGVPVTTDIPALLVAADVVLDFTTPASSVALAAAAGTAGVAHVIGTTGFSDSDLTALGRVATRIAIVRSGNMSLGVNLLAALVKQAAAALDQNFDIEIMEMHHRRKVDAPSGTALLLGEAAAAGRGITLDEHAVHSRDGHTGERPSGAIGFAALRGGTVVGDHSVVFAGPGERLVLGHIAEDRGLFAQGALTAALWTRRRPPGLYSMADVLGLSR